MKDSKVTLDNVTSILCSHLNFGDARRGWDFVSPGHGDLDIDAMIRALNRAGYQGPLSVEWEDSGMDREFGATESAAWGETERLHRFGGSPSTPPLPKNKSNTGHQSGDERWLTKSK